MSPPCPLTSVIAGFRPSARCSSCGRTPRRSCPRSTPAARCPRPGAVLAPGGRIRSRTLAGSARDERGIYPRCGKHARKPWLALTEKGRLYHGNGGHGGGGTATGGRSRFCDSREDPRAWQAIYGGRTIRTLIDDRGGEYGTIDRHH